MEEFVVGQLLAQHIQRDLFGEMRVDIRMHIDEILQLITGRAKKMERFTWKAYIIPGMLEQYIKRHEEIWPEMTRVLNDAGIRNYSIWTTDEELFGYYECDSVAFAAKVQRESEVVARWNVYMKDVMVMAIDPVTGAPQTLRQVFLHN